MKKTIVKFLEQEDGTAVIEYVLVIGLLVVAAIVVIKTTGTKVVARWTSIGNSIP